MSVHSFISSSNQRLQRLAWKPILIGAFLLFITFITIMELRLAAKGFHRSVTDSEMLWLRERFRASNLGERALILIGGSRIQLGIDLDVLRQKTELEPVQLAIDGTPPLPILESLARDPSIHGTIIVDYYDYFLQSANANDRARLYEEHFKQVNHHRRIIDYEVIESYLTDQLRNSLRSYADGARPLTSLLTRILVRDATPQYLVTLRDRSRLADYRLVSMPAFYYGRVIRNLGQEIDFPTNSTYGDVERILKEKINQLEPNENAIFINRLDYLESLTQMIQERGGKVIFVVMPSSGLVREIERKRFPRSLFWDYLVKRTSARTIHFEDFPSLNYFVCPDGAHLDYRDRVRFTTALINVANLGR